MVVTVHTSFVEYTHGILLRIHILRLAWIDRRPRSSDLHECLVAFVRVDTGFIGTVSTQDSEPSAEDLGVCNVPARQPREKQHRARGRFPDLSTTPALLVSPPRWSVPKPLATSLLKHCTPHSSHRSSPNCLAQLQRLAINFSSSNHVLATISLIT